MIELPNLDTPECGAYIKFVEFREADDGVHVRAVSSLKKKTLSNARKRIPMVLRLTNPFRKGVKRCLRATFEYNAWFEVVKQLYSTGRNHNVIERLPRLPARNVYASHFDDMTRVSTCFRSKIPRAVGKCRAVRYSTLRGSSRVKIVTKGM